MGQGEAEFVSPTIPDAPGDAPHPRRSVWSRFVACLAMIPLIGFIGMQGQSLWAEWDSLRQDQARERASVVVGYKEINPDVSYARSPTDWTHDEGDESLLWACWKDGEHHWFRFARGDIDVRQLTWPIGRDVIRAIDYPLYEEEGGETWARVPRDAPVIGFEREGSAVAYPMKVLQKVQVINDQLGDRPVLYDRATRSLWSEGEGGMFALAGRLKGTNLKRLDTPDVVEWEDWRGDHPSGRLVVGADRTRGMPLD